MNLGFENERPMTIGELAAKSRAVSQQPEVEEETSKIDVKVEAEEFKADLKMKLISTSELEEMLTEKLAKLFDGYEGCREFSMKESTEPAIDLVFRVGALSKDTDTKKIVAIESLEEAEKSTSKEMDAINRFNRQYNIRRANERGIIDENYVGFRMTDDAIAAIKKLFRIRIDKDANNQKFRKTHIGFASVQINGRIENVMVVRGLDFKNILGFIFGYEYDYRVEFMAMASNGNYGRLLKVYQIRPSSVKHLYNKYAGRNIVSDGIIRPKR